MRVRCIKKIIFRCRRFRYNWIILSIRIASNSFFGTCSVLIIPEIRVKPVGGNISVTPVGDVFTAVPVLFVIGYEITGCWVVSLKTSNKNFF